MFQQVGEAINAQSGGVHIAPADQAVGLPTTQPPASRTAAAVSRRDSPEFTMSSTISMRFPATTWS